MHFFLATHARLLAGHLLTPQPTLCVAAATHFNQMKQVNANGTNQNVGQAKDSRLTGMDAWSETVRILSYLYMQQQFHKKAIPHHVLVHFSLLYEIVPATSHHHWRLFAALPGTGTKSWRQYETNPLVRQIRTPNLGSRIKFQKKQISPRRACQNLTVDGAVRFWDRVPVSYKMWKDVECRRGAKGWLSG